MYIPAIVLQSNLDILKLRPPLGVSKSDLFSKVHGIYSNAAGLGDQNQMGKVKSGLDRWSPNQYGL